MTVPFLDEEFREQQLRAADQVQVVLALAVSLIRQLLGHSLQ